MLPGSHKTNWLPGPPSRGVPWPQPEGTLQITANPGDLVVFDRRLWHARSDNGSVDGDQRTAHARLRVPDERSDLRLRRERKLQGSDVRREVRAEDDDVRSEQAGRLPDLRAGLPERPDADSERHRPEHVLPDLHVPGLRSRHDEHVDRRAKRVRRARLRVREDRRHRPGDVLPEVRVRRAEGRRDLRVM